MRRVIVQKTPIKLSTRSRRVREEAEVRPSGRPEIRKDIQRTWWPDG